ncbi:MAG: hypothetical protein M1827_003148 [Pycnora praestabilis]|nr:MAG: hypothetical protein M1827_003148 [Pycnora praestabilis]
MFSYLRPHNNKRTSPSSNPTSPSSYQLTYFSDPHLQSPDPKALPPRLPDSESPHSNSPVSPVAPVLPPIPRVASRYERIRDIDATARRHSAQGIQYMSRDEEGQDSSPASQTSSTAGFSPSPGISAEDFRRPASRPPTAPSTTLRNSDGRSRARGWGYGDNETYFNANPAPTSSSPSMPLYSSHQSSSSTLPTSRPSSAKATQAPSTASHHVRPSKTKLNLLNPMSLLMRRRSSQAVGHLATVSTTHKNVNVPAMKLPDDYDPRIRGTGIHDFSVPRQRRNLSYNDAVSPGLGRARSPGSPYFIDSHGVSDGPILERVEQDGLKHIEREHTPMFTEQFGDDVKPWQEEQTSEHTGLSQEEASNHQVVSLAPPDREAPLLPPFARNLPPDFELLGPTSTEDKEPEKDSLVVVTTELQASDNTSTRTSLGSVSPNSPSKSRSRAVSGSDASFQPIGLPKHLKSNASRFSFDMGGLGSAAQEKLLEEKHKQVAAKKKFRAEASGDFDTRDLDGDEDNDMNDYDNMDDDCDFEERIPGVNTDADDEPEPNITEIVEGFDFSSVVRSTLTSPISPTSGLSGLTSPARTSTGQMIGVALSGEVLPSDVGLPPSNTGVQKEGSNIYDPCVDVSAGIEGPNGLTTISNPVEGGSEVPSLQVGSPRQSTVKQPSIESNEDDLYFDDGIIEEPTDHEAQAFDESIFDLDKEEYGRSMQDLRPPPALQQSTTDSSPTKYTSEVDENDSIVPQDSQSTDTTFPPMLNPVGNAISYQASQMHQRPFGDDIQEHSGLTQHNLAAYHNALVAAANQAAASGKFLRTESVVDGGVHDQDSEPHPALVFDPSHFSQDPSDFPSDVLGVVSGDEIDYDSAMEDDPMIAAANAEALANDCDGFYGQEFGFYAQSNGAGEAEFSNGGFFGPRGIDGIVRSYSGRMAFQEPNLTPITERSEYSNRTSYISLSIPAGQSTQNIGSPGLAQLASMMGPDFKEDDMTLSGLMKLRRGAWGGSNASLRSAGSQGSPANSSPYSYLPPLGTGGFPTAAGPIGGSSYSLVSSAGMVSSNGFGSDEGSSPSSPTITVPHHVAWAGLPEEDEKSSASDSSPVRTSWTKGHSRSGSGNDSVSYVKEESEDGAGQWVLERRRTGETGEMEIVGREVVRGGRI